MPVLLARSCNDHCSQPEVYKPDVQKPEKPDKVDVKPEEAKPEIYKPDVQKPEKPEKPDIKPEDVKPEIYKPDKPEIQKPDIQKPEKPDINKPEINKPELPQKPEKVGSDNSRETGQRTSQSTASAWHVLCTRPHMLFVLLMLRLLLLVVLPLVGSILPYVLHCAVLPVLHSTMPAHFQPCCSCHPSGHCFVCSPPSLCGLAHQGPLDLGRKRRWEARFQAGPFWWLNCAEQFGAPWFCISASAFLLRAPGVAASGLKAVSQELLLQLVLLVFENVSSVNDQQKPAVCLLRTCSSLGLGRTSL